MGKGIILGIFCAAFVAGCTTSGGSFCSVEHPIRPTKAEVATLSDATVAAILAHNEKGQRLCGWKQ